MFENEYQPTTGQHQYKRLTWRAAHGGHEEPLGIHKTTIHNPLLSVNW